MKHKASKEIIEFIANEEGFRDTAYKPYDWDRWTVGHGFTYIKGVPVKESDTITLEESLKVLEDEVHIMLQRLNALNMIPENCTQNQLDAVLSLCFNIGVDAFYGSETGKLFKEGKDISHKFPLWCKSGGIKIEGLRKRRLREQKIYDREIYTLDWS